MSNLKENLENLFGNLEQFVTTKTVVGDPIQVGEMVIIPLVDISFGVGAGSTEKKSAQDNSGAGGLGAKISPAAMLIINHDIVQMVSVKNSDHINKLIELVPNILAKFDLPCTKKDENKAD